MITSLLLCLAASPAPLDDTPVQLTTSDGLIIHGTLHAANTEGLAPAVLLLHGGRQDRSEWAPLLPLLHARGWTTLAIDLRGHGESGGKIKDWGAFFNDPGGVPLDVEAAMTFLRKQEGVDPERVAVVGSSVGANLACVAVQKFGARGGAFFSGKTQAAKSLAGEPLNDLRSMLFIAAEKEQGGARARWAEELSAKCAEPSRAIVVPGSSTHGAGLMQEAPGLDKQLVAFLSGVPRRRPLRALEAQSCGWAAGCPLTSTHPTRSARRCSSSATRRAGRGASTERRRRTSPAWASMRVALDQRSGKEAGGVTNEDRRRCSRAGSKRRVHRCLARRGRGAAVGSRRRGPRSGDPRGLVVLRKPCAGDRKPSPRPRRWCALLLPWRVLPQAELHIHSGGCGRGSLPDPDHLF